MGKKRERFKFDSAYFVAFDLMHSALKTGLKTASRLSITQYRILVKLLNASPQALGQSELGYRLHLKPNVVTHALARLEDDGFVQRGQGSGDGRSRSATITDAGIAHIAEVNTSLVNELYSQFPTDNPEFRRILEASIIAGATIDSDDSGKTARYFPASRTLASFELIAQTMEESLREACGASFAECRIMQRLGEEGIPLRIGSLSQRLHMSATTVARAVDQLVERGWVQRMGIPHDKKAVFVAVTAEGRRNQGIITHTIDETAERHLWGKLDEAHRQAIAHVVPVVFADLQAKKEAEQKTMLSLLQPL